MHRFAHLIFVSALLAGPAWSQADKPADNTEEAELFAQMHALQAQLGEGKRDFIAEQLSLNPSAKVEADHELVWLHPHTALNELRHDAHAWAVAVWLRRG